MKKKLFSLVVVSVMLVSIFAGCADSESESETAADRDTIRLAFFTDFTLFDPMNSGMMLDRALCDNIFERLLFFHDGEFENVLAEDVSVTPDGLSYHVRLKQGVRFHNGERFTAHCVAFSMYRAQDSVFFGNVTTPITYVEIHDDYNLTIHLSSPSVPFLQAVIAGVHIMNERAVTEAGDNVGFQPVGTGPYKFVSFEPGQSVTLIANDDWHRGEVPIRLAIVMILTDPSSSLMAVEAGDIDLTFSIPPIEATRLEASDHVNFRRNPTTGSGFINFNLERAPFDCLYFRLAFAHAINRDDIVDIGMEGMAVHSGGIWDYRFEGSSGGLFPPPEYNMELARYFLEKSSFDGRTLVFISGMEEYRRIMMLVQEQMRLLGVNVELEMMENNAWVAQMRSGDFDISTVVFTYDLDVDHWSNYFHSSAIGHFGFSRLNRPEVDDAFDRGRTILDREERIRVYSVAEQIIHEEVKVIPIYFRVVPMVYHRDLVVSRAQQNGIAHIVDMSWR